MKFLQKISDDFALISNAITQKFAWIGTSGGGKTYGATAFAESLWNQGGQFVVLDPVGVWYGLRLQKDGKKPSHINIPVFGGLHGDVPLEATSGALIADLIIDKEICAIIDVSQFEFDTDKARFATAFAARFFFRKKAAPSAVHIFLEECQEFVPQVPQRGEERMLHEFTRMQKIGRNFGIGMSLITQRPQEVSKRVLNLSSTLFAFRTTGSHEREAIERWMKDNRVDGENFLDTLPSLETGCPHVWSPEWLKMSKVVKILPKKTFDASATPEIGAKSVVRHLAPIDLEKIKSDMAATIEKAKKDDPKLLHKEIERLSAELGKRVNTVTKEAAPMGVSQWREYGKKFGYWSFFETDINQKAGLAWGKLVVREWERYANDLKKAIETSVRAGTLMMNVAPPRLTPPDWLTPSNEDVKVGSVMPIKLRLRPTERPIVEYRSEAPKLNPEIEDEVILKAGAHKMLDVLMSRYPMKMNRSQFATLSGMSPKSSTFDQYLAALKRAGKIAVEDGNYIPTEGTLSDFEAGDRLPEPKSAEEIRGMWRSKLKAGAWKLLNILIEERQRFGREPMTREHLAQEAQMSLTSSTFDQYVALLKRNGLIEKVGDGFVAVEELI